MYHRLSDSGCITQENKTKPSSAKHKPAVFSFIKGPKLKGQSDQNGATSLMKTQLQRWSHCRLGSVDRSEVIS